MPRIRISVPLLDNFECHKPIGWIHIQIDSNQVHRLKDHYLGVSALMDTTDDTIKEIMAFGLTKKSTKK